MNNILDQKIYYNNGTYEYRLGGNGSDTDSDDLREIDCSNLVNQMLNRAGYSIPYENTAGLVNSIYFEEVSPYMTRLIQSLQSFTKIIL